MNITERIEAHETAICILELIKRARLKYRSHYENAATYERAGLYGLAKKERARSIITLAAIKRLTERYEVLILNNKE